jgi:hypothetical protein
MQRLQKIFSKKKLGKDIVVFVFVRPNTYFLSLLLEIPWESGSEQVLSILLGATEWSVDDVIRFILFFIYSRGGSRISSYGGRETASEAGGLGVPLRPPVGPGQGPDGGPGGKAPWGSWVLKIL